METPLAPLKPGGDGHGWVRSLPATGCLVTKAALFPSFHLLGVFSVGGEESFEVTPLVVPMRACVDSIKRPTRNDLHTQRGLCMAPPSPSLGDWWVVSHRSLAEQCSTEPRYKKSTNKLETGALVHCSSRPSLSHSFSRFALLSSFPFLAFSLSCAPYVFFPFLTFPCISCFVFPLLLF